MQRQPEKTFRGLSGAWDEETVLRMDQFQFAPPKNQKPWNDSIPIEIPTNNGLQPRFQSGANGFRPSTVWMCVKGGLRGPHMLAFLANFLSETNNRAKGRL